MQDLRPWNKSSKVQVNSYSTRRAANTAAHLALENRLGLGVVLETAHRGCGTETGVIVRTGFSRNR